MGKERVYKDINWGRVDLIRLKELSNTKRQEVRALMEDAASVPDGEISNQKEQHELLMKILGIAEQPQEETESFQIGGYELTVMSAAGIQIEIFGRRALWATKPKIRSVENLVMAIAQETGLGLDMPYYNPKETRIKYELRIPPIEMLKLYKP